MQTRELQLRTDRILVDRLNWQIAAGECWCVVGRNGAGKSTLLRALAGLRRPDGGVVERAGKTLGQWSLPALARERAYLPQARNDSFGYRAIEVVLVARHPYREAAYWESKEDYAVAQAALVAVDAAHLAERDIRSLSGGERQRVAIAAVLVQDAPLLLLDEPTSALDLAHQVGVAMLLRKLCREQQKSIVMVSHDLNLAHKLASHALLLMDDGAWHAGRFDDVMQPPLLSACLGHPVELVRHGERTLYVAADMT
ncbi:MAG TPA: ABC transporter ATP-binding protein [Oxalicibacterium sp.]|jgi:iron complex transport system ATP-binding protein|nr:ABC transporter ATP-binding protein [Oxalicibacterium sp.]